jgi:hypothetical protein
MYIREFQGAAAVNSSNGSFVAEHSGLPDRAASVNRFKELEAQRLLPNTNLYQELAKNPYYTGEFINNIVKSTTLFKSTSSNSFLFIDDDLNILLILAFSLFICHFPRQRAAHGTSATTG